MILPKKQKPQATLDRLAEHLDEKAYTEIERTDPTLAGILAEVVEAGMKPDDVFRYELSNGRRSTQNKLSHWFTIRITDLERLPRKTFSTNSYVNGKTKKVPCHFWPISYWEPLAKFWMIEPATAT